MTDMGPVWEAVSVRRCRQCGFTTARRPVPSLCPLCGFDGRVQDEDEEA